MKRKIPVTFILLVAAGILTFFACNKTDSASTASDADASSDITVAATAASPTSDSVVIEQDCGHGGTRDSISQSELPAAAADYLTANYAGYIFHSAYAVKDSADTLSGYVAVIYFNDKPVAVKFDGDGVFEEILKQRSEGRKRG